MNVNFEASTLDFDNPALKMTNVPMSTIYVLPKEQLNFKFLLYNVYFECIRRCNGMEKTALPEDVLSIVRQFSSYETVIKALENRKLLKEMKVILSGQQKT